MGNVEIEIKVKLNGLNKLVKLLEQEGKFTGEDYQKDEYFVPSHRDFLSVKPVEEWLRLRESGNNSVTYKKWHYDKSGKSNHCDEYETNVDDAEQMRNIFEAINLKPVIVVEKRRKSWRYMDYEVSVDEVTDLGSFVEVEYKGAEAKPDSEKIVGEMAEFLRKVGCTKIERNYTGYPFMILYPDETKLEEM